ncbi:hypothetical protein HPB50_021506 [Hyalomma asiaticum]|uniref:Uncharacterized protein n=1 Tax=Hyalomma asiaticum TaxID=266040 RepID=A0ACB7SK84_HYAAI|nr:hypothetical protein HPB50_021506 [Hyalomma asiaticum]
MGTTESDVLSQMQQRDYLQLLVRQLRARRGATNTLASRQQPGSTAAATSRHVSEEEWSLQQQIRDVLGRLQGACQSGQMRNPGACESFQQPQQHLAREQSYKSSSKPRTSMSYTNARTSEESTAVRSSAQIVPPWNDRPRWPYPYTACQTALQIWKAQQGILQDLLLDLLRVVRQDELQMSTEQFQPYHLSNMQWGKTRYK